MEMCGIVCIFESLNLYTMTNVNEIFLPIKGYEGYYEISNLGNVKSLSRKIVRTKDGRTQTVKERIIKPGTGTNGYYFVHCRKDGNGAYLYIHRLVGIHFVSNNDNKPCVNHKDGNKKNNAATNLEWVNHKENSQHAVKNGLLSACWTGFKLSKGHKESISNGLKKHYENHLHWTKQRKQG